MPSQLNGKRSAGARRRPTQPRCPRNGTADEAALSGSSASGAHATGGSRLREGRRGRSASPDTGQQAGRASCSAHVACARGEAGRLPLVRASHHVCISTRRALAARRGRARSPFVSSSRPSSCRAAAQTRLDPVIITGTREPQALEPQHVPTSSSSTPRRSATAAPTRSRTCCAASPACRSSRNGGPGPDLGLLHPRREHEQHGRPGRRRAHRLGDARPGRVRGAEPGADRAHRGAARPGVEPLRRRRGRRRGPDLHPPRRGRAARRRGAAAVGGYRSRQRRRRRQRLGRRRSTTPSRSADESSDGVSAIAPGDRVRQLQPRRRRLQARLGQRCGSASRRRRAIASACTCSRPGSMRSTTRPSSSRRLHSRSVARLPQPPEDARRRARLPRRSRPAAGPRRVQLGRSIDDLKSGGTTTEPLHDRARAGDLAERAGARRRTSSSCSAYEHLRRARQRRRLRRARRSGATTPVVLGYSGRFGAHRLQADVRHDDNSAYGGNTTGRIGYASTLDARR